MSSNGKEAIESIVMFMRKFQLLREYIRRLLENDEEVKDDLITEPDEIEEREGDDEEVKEFSAVGAVAGASTPLGTGPTHPVSSRRKKKQKKRK